MVNPTTEFTSSRCSFDKKNLFKILMENHCSYFIVCHNHPGDDKAGPSSGDSRSFHDLLISGKIYNIPLLDNIIVCQNGKHFYSYADNGHLCETPLLIESERKTKFNFYSEPFTVNDEFLKKTCDEIFYNNIKKNPCSFKN